MRRVPCGRVMGHGESCCDGYLCASCERVLHLEKIIKALGHGADKYYPDGCWCDAYTGNPMLGGKHMPSCRMAQQAMKEIPK